jgi:hypothetical protein
MPTPFNPQFHATLSKDGHNVKIDAMTQADLDAECAPYVAKGYVKQ